MSAENNMPDFLVIGGAKAGTTALYKYLDQHPEVYMSPYKEPHFFALEGHDLKFNGPRDREMMGYLTVNELEPYQGLFEGRATEKVAGEASPLYLYYPQAPQRIHHYVPQAKLIAVLRNPVERAYSNFLHHLRDGREPYEDFSRALADEGRRLTEGWYGMWAYREAGFYAAQLRRYLKLFDREQMRIYLYEDLVEDPRGLMADIFEFLGVESSFEPDMSRRYNESGVHRNRALGRLYNFIVADNPVRNAIKPMIPTRLRRRMTARVVSGIRSKNLSKPPFPPELRARLIEDYREDIAELQEITGRDLSRWLEQPPVSA